MAVIVDRVPRGTIHPFHALLLAGAVPLFLGALLSDITYARSYKIQWSNFASWLIAGVVQRLFAANAKCLVRQRKLRQIDQVSKRVVHDGISIQEYCFLTVAVCATASTVGRFVELRRRTR